VVLVVLAVGAPLLAAAADDDGDGVLVYFSCCLGTEEALAVKNEVNTKFGVTRVCSAHSRALIARPNYKAGQPGSAYLYLYQLDFKPNPSISQAKMAFAMKQAAGLKVATKKTSTVCRATKYDAELVETATITHTTKQHSAGTVFSPDGHLWENVCDACSC
jgi:hypothetical protein